MRIRRATESDVDAVQTLSQLSFEYDSQLRRRRTSGSAGGLKEFDGSGSMALVSTMRLRKFVFLRRNCFFILCKLGERQDLHNGQGGLRN